MFVLALCLELGTCIVPKNQYTLAEYRLRSRVVVCSVWKAARSGGGEWGDVWCSSHHNWQFRVPKRCGIVVGPHGLVPSRIAYRLLWIGLVCKWCWQWPRQLNCRLVQVWLVGCGPFRPVWFGVGLLPCSLEKGSDFGFGRGGYDGFDDFGKS